VRALVSTPFSIVVDGEAVRGTLADFWEIPDSAIARRTAKAAVKLRRNLQVRVDMEASTVTIRATAIDSSLAKQLLQSTLRLVDSLAIAARARQAEAEGRFLDERIRQVEAELRASEASLASFAERNRSYSESPLLRLEFERLQRSVDLQQAVLREIAQNRESVRLNESRDTPALVPVESPVDPLLPDRRFLAMRLVFGSTLGALAAIALTLLGMWWARMKVLDPSGWQEICSTVAELRWRR